MKENYTYKLEEKAGRHINIHILKKKNDFGVKHGNRENSRKTEWLNDTEKELQGLKKGPDAKIHQDRSEQQSRKYLIQKSQAMMANMDTRLKDSHLSITDWLWNWVDDKKLEWCCIAT